MKRTWIGWLGFAILAVAVLTVSVQSWRAPDGPKAEAGQ